MSNRKTSGEIWNLANKITRAADDLRSFIIIARGASDSVYEIDASQLTHPLEMMLTIIEDIETNFDEFRRDVGVAPGDERQAS